jgi:ribonuclease P/MRP protein subunit POP5
MRLKILLPSLRERKRYVLFKIISEEPINYTSFKELVNSTILKFYGELTFGKFGFKFLDERWNEKEQIGVVKCNHKFVPNIILAFGLLQRIGDSRINVKILKVSGTIKSLLKNLRIKDKNLSDLR